MSTKSKRTVTRTYQSSSSEARSSHRSPSPARISRQQEKETLTGLNDRLAAYIDKVRSLESENSRLTLQISSFEETSAREVAGVKALYDRELADARRLIDELGKEKAKLLIDVGKYKSESEEWTLKYTRKDRECASLAKKLADAEARVPEAEARVVEIEKEKQRYMADCGRLRGDIAELERQLSQAKKQLEEETLARVDLENKIQSLKEELAFKAQLHETQMNETRSRMEYSLDEIDTRVDLEYQARLQRALQEFRAEQEIQNKVYREEVEVMYESKLKGLEGELANRGDVSDETRVELSNYRSRVNDLQAQISKLASQNSSLEGSVSALEAELRRERDTSRALLAAKEKDLMAMREEMDQQLAEYQDLLEIKCSLDLELAAYRKLLETEEDRLNSLSASRANLSAAQSSSKSRKRKRVTVEETSSGVVAGGQLSASGTYSCSFTSHGSVSISEMEENGKFIKIYNSSNKEMSLGGWHLQHTAGEQETSYKFHRSVKIEPKGYVTVWSSSSDVDSDPSTETDKKHNFTMKGLDFFVADSMRTVLSDGKSKEQATLEMTLASSVATGGSSSSSTTSSTTYYDERAVYEGERAAMGDPATNGDNKSCAIM